MLTASKVHTGTRRFREAYSAFMAPLSRELGMAQTALDILLFLANNPGMDTARDICAYMHLKPGIVSFHVDNLVREGLLERRPSPIDRRRCPLACTAQANPVLMRGKQMQKEFSQKLTRRLSPQELEVCMHCLDVFERNLSELPGDRSRTQI